MAPRAKYGVFVHSAVDGTYETNVRLLTQWHFDQITLRPPVTLLAIHGPYDQTEIASLPPAGGIPEDRVLWQRSIGTT